MDKPASKNRWYAGLALYGILLALVLLYLQFPSDALEDYLETSVTNSNPRIGISLERTRPTLTLGLNIRDAAAYLKPDPDRALLRASGLEVQPQLFSLMRGRPRYTFECRSGGGRINGWFQTVGKGGPNPLSVSVQIDQVPVAGLADLRPLIGRTLEGILAGTITFKGSYTALTAGTSQMDLRVSNGKVGFARPFLGLEAIKFDELLVQMALRNQNLNVTRIELFGPDLQGSMSGNIYLAKDINQSRLNLRGNFEPFANLFTGSGEGAGDLALVRQRLKRGRISFMITGTLQEPRLKFI